MDDFYGNDEPNPEAGLVAQSLNFLLEAPSAVWVTIALAPILVIIATRIFSGYASRKASNYSDSVNTVPMIPYWIPFVGHGWQFLMDPVRLLREARSQTQHGIYALNLGSKTYNVIYDPAMVKAALQQKESTLQLTPMALSLVVKVFGVPKQALPKYEAAWDEFVALSNYLLKEPHLSNMLKVTARSVENMVPKMISFTDREIDLQPWERHGRANFVSENEMEVDLMAMLRDLLGHAAVAGVFGKSLLEKYPNILHDVYELETGMIYFAMGVPAWIPFPGVVGPHLARRRLWTAMDEFQRALDADFAGNPDPMWGDLDDVSEFIMERHKVYQKYNIEVKERADLTVLWALLINSNLLVYWHLLHILATPGLVDRLRTEIAPFTQVAKPFSIGSFSEAPKLNLDHEGLAKKCPLFKSTYLEALRMCDQPWSIRTVASDLVLSTSNTSDTASSFKIHKGDFIKIPHELHMHNPVYFPDPSSFNPERFLVRADDGSLTTDMGTIRPYGGGASMCKGRIFAESECLALVAGVLMMWEFEPAGTTGWMIPKLKKASAVSLPEVDTRVRIRRRRFEWDE
ncbi:cytochrome P450 [Calycina marina]|uniref:Cytochrome P450 n=1 Tax=Calycina marina TaxID=1763456 RepID=A0A9P7Z9L6_9HELO|nr:cytochrome P450 [Calycina marina]